MLRCAELNIAEEALSEMTMGMVYDMIIEKINDNETYPYEANQDDIYEMFGR